MMKLNFKTHFKKKKIYRYILYNNNYNEHRKND